MLNKTSKCFTCGYEWPTGTHGGHSCSENLKKKVKLLLDNDGIDGRYDEQEFLKARNALRGLIPKNDT